MAAPLGCALLFVKKGFGGLLLVVLGVGSRPRRCASLHASKERNFHTRKLKNFRLLQF